METYPEISFNQHLDNSDVLEKCNKARDPRPVRVSFTSVQLLINEQACCID